MVTAFFVVCLFHHQFWIFEPFIGNSKTTPPEPELENSDLIS
jgi:hypothetical protein